jgi:FkbM family methyltransferase
MSYVFFDVGANNGYSSVPVAQRNPETMVYGFEPTPQMIDIIESRIVGLPNYKLTKVAVSDYNGKAVFNVAGNADWGCSSLLPLSEKASTEWYGRTDMFVTEQIEVDVIRLDTFIEQNGIERINHLHIDTQGSDLKVLRGLGKYIDIVDEGVMEAANKDDILYVGQNTKAESIAFLEENGFIVTDVQLNDLAENEVNIYFRRK